MTPEHPALERVLAAVAASGWHAERWGDLRREAFLGAEPWADLQAWCLKNTLIGELAFGQSSRVADVQFRRQLPKARRPVFATPPTSKEG